MTATKYKYPNRFLPTTILSDLDEGLRAARVSDVLRIAEAIGCGSEIVEWEKKGSVTLEDIEAWVGNNQYADAVYPIWFYGGPERAAEKQGEEPFELMSGTLLTWLTDRILYAVSSRGPEIWHKVKL